MRIMECPEAIDVMDLALEESLEPVLIAPFEAHLAECPPCQTYFEQLRWTREALRALPPQGSTSPQRAELIERFRRERDEETN
jgi:predicted anti-sigma-YlaC factor YlaD